MRIYGNRPIKTLAGQLTRPTTARVREALFNIWQQKLSGCRWLDLCAGNGSMGAEALCLDPPYESGLYLPVLTAISQSNLLDSLGEIAVEHNPKSWPAINLEGLTICRQKRYGNTTLTFYQKADVS